LDFAGFAGKYEGWPVDEFRTGGDLGAVPERGRAEVAPNAVCLPVHPIVVAAAGLSGL